MNRDDSAGLIDSRFRSRDPSAMKSRHDSARRAFLGVLSCCMLLLGTHVVAKRAAPKPVPAVVVQDVEYSAPVDLMAFVVATDIHSHKELWRQRIYVVNITADLERDVQDVFITSLAADHGTLVITNERYEMYILDLATRQVIRRR